MHPGKDRGVPNRLRQTETCSLYAVEGNWFHICSMCKHPDMRLLQSEAQRDRQNPTALHEAGQAWAVAHPYELWE
eukprot:6419279-Pyramimonas_sp.AAC.1